MNDNPHPLDQDLPENVVVLRGVTPLDLDPKRVLKAAYDRELEDVVVIAHGKDGGWYFASSLADGGDVLWHLRKAERKLFDAAEEYANPPTGGETA